MNVSKNLEVPLATMTELTTTIVTELALFLRMPMLLVEIFHCSYINMI